MFRELIAFLAFNIYFLQRFFTDFDTKCKEPRYKKFISYLIVMCIPRTFVPPDKAIYSKTANHKEKPAQLHKERERERKKKFVHE